MDDFFKPKQVFYFDIEPEPQIVVKVKKMPNKNSVITSRYLNQDYSKKYNEFRMYSRYSFYCRKEKLVEYENGLPTNWEL